MTFPPGCFIPKKSLPEWRLDSRVSYWLAQNNRLGWKLLTLKKTLAYNGTDLIIALKVFVVQALDHKISLRYFK